MNITGYFKLNTKDADGNIIDTYEHKNTIMNNGRTNVMNWLMGASNNTSLISKFVLGTGGYNSGAAPAAFGSSRVETFSEENGDDYYTLDFSVDPLNIVSVAGVSKTVTPDIDSEEGAPTIHSVVTVTTDEALFTITYSFEIPQSNANGTGTRQYSEAALYCEQAPDLVNRIFAMRTFPTRAKDSTISYSISWTITFG